jgi:hypothetical protein
MLKLVLMVKKNLRLYVGLILFVTLAAVVSVPIKVAAQNMNQQANPRTEPTESSLEDRQEARRQQLTAQISSAESEKIVNVCSAAQAKIKSASDRASGVYEVRKNRYDQITAKLLSLSERVKNQGLDTQALDQQLTTLQTQIDDFFVSFDDHRQAVSDTLEINCQTDPAAFKLALEDAREKRKKMIAQSKQISATIKDSIKPVLQDLKQQLSANTNTQGTQSDNQQVDVVDNLDTPVSSLIQGGQSE